MVETLKVNALEKYAAKQTMSKALIERLSRAVYGAKPNRAETFGSGGALVGGVSGGSIGASAGARLADKIGLGRNLADEASTIPNFLWKQLKDIGRSGVQTATGSIGATQGARAGGALGKALGKRLDKKEMAKYLARRKKINKRLAAGGGVATLAALASGKK